MPEQDDTSDELRELEKVEQPGKIIQTLLINDDIMNFSAEELGTRLWKLIDGKDAAILSMPEWWVSEELGDWTNLLFAHIDKETEKAYHINEATSAKPLVVSIGIENKKKVLTAEEMIEEDRIKNWKSKTTTFEDCWAPKSLLNYGFRGEHMMPEDSIIITQDDSGGYSATTGRENDGDFAFGEHLVRNVELEEGGTMRVHKVALKFGYDEQKIDDVKEMDWDETHRTYDDDESCWLIDADSMCAVTCHLTEKGYDVAVTEDANQTRIDPAIEGKTSAKSQLPFSLPD